MRPTTDQPLSTAREKLVCFALLRQMETPCEILQGAYQRLIDAACQASGPDIALVILGWLEAELRSLRALDDEPREREGHLMQAAIALASALRQ